jgi:tripartite-type tricarboxylate transporter receptor subunit TctC
MLTRRLMLKSVAALGMGLQLPGMARAAFPDQVIRIQVPFAAGGNIDIQCRLLATKMGELLKTSVIVENRTGAGGTIGAEQVARSKPDGYSILAGSNGPMTVSPAVRTKIGYDPIKDFAPIVLTSRVPMVLAVSDDFPAKTLAEYIAHAKANPDKVTVASSGAGSSSHLVIVDFAMRTGIKLVHVPYRGAAATVPDLIAGSVNSVVTEISNVLPVHKDGKARILAVASAGRSPLLPSIPTFSEAGVPNFQAFSFCGLLVPAKTPSDIIETLRKAVVTSLADSDIAKRFVDIGLEIPQASDLTSQAFADLLQKELAAAKKIAAAANIKTDN